MLLFGNTKSEYPDFPSTLIRRSLPLNWSQPRSELQPKFRQGTSVKSRVWLLQERWTQYEKHNTSVLTFPTHFVGKDPDRVSVKMGVKWLISISVPVGVVVTHLFNSNEDPFVWRFNVPFSKCGKHFYPSRFLNSFIWLNGFYNSPR